MCNFQEDSIFDIKTDKEFNDLCIKVFKFQYQNNLVYRKYVDLLKKDFNKIASVKDIPFLPIELFKNHRVLHKDCKKYIEFLSSGTTGQIRSRHFVANEDLYKRSFLKSFELFYGNVKDYCFIALLPGYSERKSSSLVYMVNELMQISNNQYSGFYLNDFENLASTLNKLKSLGQKFVLIGVSHALVDFADACRIDLSGGIVMETGGMKGRKREMLKSELHSYLKGRFNVSAIHSEYGMTELLSQAYSNGKGLFATPSWMRVLIRDIYDPFSYVLNGKTGGINIIDLANIYSCSFIETKDLGVMYSDGRFEITGRFDSSDIRGCNLLLS